MLNLWAESRQAILRLASHTLRHALSGARTDVPAAPTFALPADPALSQPAGCFVSLHSRATHRLRGCIGIFQTDRPLTEVLPEAALSVLRDPRFTANPITLAEIPHLEIEVTVLGPLAAVDGPLNFEPLRQGIYLTVANRAGCFLPQVARDTGWTREQLLERLCTEKMGLPANSWQLPDARLQTFETEIIGPAPLE